MAGHRAHRLAFLAAGLVLAASLAGAEEAAEQQLSTVERQLEVSAGEQARIAAEVSAAIEAQDEIAEKLIIVSEQLKSQEAAITDGEAELKRLNEEHVGLMADLGEKQDALSELLSGLMRMERNPPPALVVEPDDVLKALRGAMLLGTIVPELQAEAEKLTADLERLDRLRANIRSGKNALRAEIAKLGQAKLELDSLLAQKRQLAEARNADLEDEKKRSKQLAKRAKNLKQLLASLAEEKKRAEAERAGKEAAAERERRRLEEQSLQPRVAFVKAKGRLPLPVEGQILRRFGDPDGFGGKIQGLALATRMGGQVTVPADARVEFAGPFRSYGQLVILNPGGGYRILLAGLGNVTASVGEMLRAGEPVGQMGSGPSSVTLLGDVVQDSRPVLYIEFRNSTEAIDSGPWWAGGMKEARG